MRLSLHARAAVARALHPVVQPWPVLRCFARLFSWLPLALADVDGLLFALARAGARSAGCVAAVRVLPKGAKIHREALCAVARSCDAATAKACLDVGRFSFADVGVAIACTAESRNVEAATVLLDDLPPLVDGNACGAIEKLLLSMKCDAAEECELATRIMKKFGATLDKSFLLGEAVVSSRLGLTRVLLAHGAVVSSEMLTHAGHPDVFRMLAANAAVLSRYEDLFFFWKPFDDPEMVRAVGDVFPDSARDQTFIDAVLLGHHDNLGILRGASTSLDGLSSYVCQTKEIDIEFARAIHNPLDPMQARLIRMVEAAHAGRGDLVATLLEEDPVVPDVNFAALRVAIEAGNVAMYNLLSGHCETCNFYFELEALQVAASRGHVDIVRRYIQRRPGWKQTTYFDGNIHITSQIIPSPTSTEAAILFDASAFGFVDLVGVLVSTYEFGAGDLTSALCWAASSDTADVAEVLLAVGAKPTLDEYVLIPQKRYRGISNAVIDLAIAFESERVFNLLLDKTGVTGPSSLARSVQHDAMFERLMTRPLSVPEREMAIEVAARFNDARKVVALVGSDLDVGETMEDAVRLRRFEIAKILAPFVSHEKIEDLHASLVNTGKGDSDMARLLTGFM